MHQFARLDGGIYPPSLLQDLVRDEDKRERLRSLKVILYGGAPLERRCGEWLVANLGNRLRSLIGSTEGTMWPTQVPVDPIADWQYTHFHPASGATFVPVNASISSLPGDQEEGEEEGEQQLYELIFERSPEMEAYTNLFRYAPHLDRWPTKDLWTPHPDPAKRASHWRYRGRTDDLVLLSGEVKMYAAQLEARIETHPLVRAALVGGNQRKWPFLLVEIDGQDEQQRYRILDEQVWPWIDKLLSSGSKNVQGSLQHEAVRLRRSLVLVADPKRPFVRTPKGFVQRNATWKLYEREIEELYRGVG